MASPEDIIFKAARDDLELFGNLVFRIDTGGPLVAHFIHRKLIRNLEKVERGELRKLLECFPPRHGKSTWTTILWPAWCIGRNPSYRFLLIANTASQGSLFSMAVRDLVTSDIYRRIFPHIRPDKNRSWNADEWFIERPNKTADPTFAAMGADGAVISRGCDFLLCDDIVDAKNSATLEQIEKVNDNMKITAQSRLAPYGRHVVIGHTWHVQDYYAHCESLPTFTVFKHPAIIDENLPTERALCPEIWPIDRLKEIRAGLKSDPLWQATYQQDPRSLSDVRTDIKPFMLKWITEEEAWKRRNEFKIGISVDPAEKLKKVNDFFVATVVGNKGMDWYGLDLLRGRFLYTDIKEKMADLIHKWKPIMIGVEDKAGGEQLHQELCAMFPHLIHHRFIPIKDKRFRARNLINCAQNGRLYLSECFREVESEICGFPFHEHDDVVDGLGYGVQFEFGEPQKEYIPAYDEKILFESDVCFIRGDSDLDVLKHVLNPHFVNFDHI